MDPLELRRQLVGIRAGTLAIEVREYDEGVSCAAGAVFAPSDGSLVGAISVSAGADGFDADAFASVIRAAAMALTRRLAAGAPDDV